MILRPRQVELVDNAHKALKEFKNTIAIAPTGAGKTVMLSAVCSKHKGSVLVIQHRDELVNQNLATFKAITGKTAVICNADEKNFSDNTFAMVQTLCRENTLAKMPAYDLLIIDEAHHVAAESYQKIIKRAKELNPKIKIFGVTATPQRGDQRGLQSVFDNVCDSVSLAELIASGHLVRPRTFVIDLGLGSSLQKVRRTANDFDMSEVETIMNKQVVNDAVVREWKLKASDRQTVIFCSTIKHAEDITTHFTANGVDARMVSGEMSDTQRKATIKDFDDMKFKVIVNVAVLTEGWDCQPVSCVVLLRPCSHKSTMIQMIGRGLRKLDPERYPNFNGIKSDCMVMDFGHSILTHGDIDAGIEIKEREKMEATLRECPKCGTKHPMFLKECPICGHVYNNGMMLEKEREEIEQFGMSEVEIIEASPFKWEQLWDGAAAICSALSAWSVVVCTDKGFVALGCVAQGQVKILNRSADRVPCIASADDFMREHGDRDFARKSKSWLKSPATDKQKDILGLGRLSSMNRYTATCRITWKFNEERIYKSVQRL